MTVPTALEYDPTTPEGQHISGLFRTLKERFGGDWPGADVVQILSEWFHGLGIDPDGPVHQVDVPVDRPQTAPTGHADAGREPAAPKTVAETDEAAAGAIAVRALAAWGITAHPDGDCGKTWLAIGRDQSRRGFPRMLAQPYIVLHLRNEAREEITVTRPLVTGDRWEVVTGCGFDAERTLMTRPADQLAECVEAIAEWVTSPLPTAGAVMRAALAARGITVHTDGMSPGCVIPLEAATPAPGVCNGAHLSVADRNTSTEHDPALHTGWTVFLHDESGEPVGDPLYTGGNGEPIDCTADSEAAAAFIADWLTSRRH